MNLPIVSKASFAIALAAALACSSPAMRAQQNTGRYNSGATARQGTDRRDGTQSNDRRGRDNSAAPDMSVPDTDAPHNWTEEQIVTATVHQAWELSGRSDANFFEIVRELAEISAQNRHLELPDNSTAGRRAGRYIKQQARLDHDQLLYDIVDKSVRMTGKPTTSEAAQTNSQNR